MSQEEIKKKIEELKNRIFILEMKDHWDNSDFDLKHRMSSELRELEAQLA